MPISLAPQGDLLEIKQIKGKDETKRYLNSLGFCVGEKIKVISETNGGIILCVKDSRIAIDKNMANRIIV